LGAELLRSQQAAHVSLADLNPRVGRALRIAIERCLSIDPAHRPSAAGLAELLAPRSTRWTRSGLVLSISVLAVVCLALPFAMQVFREPNREASSPEAGSGQSFISVPTDPFELGLQYYRQREYGLAASEFMKVGKERQDGRAYAYAAYCYSVKKDNERGEYAAGEALKLGYDKADVYANRAHNRNQLGRLQQAKDDCDQAVLHDKNLRGARFSRLVTFLKLALLDRSVLSQVNEDLDWLMTQSPCPPEIWLKAAALYAMMSDNRPEARDKAIRCVRAAIGSGATSKSITSNPILAEKLGTNPEFLSALKAKSGQLRVFDDVYLVNPIASP
jgi:eukaryotic-like serine/threonine-protein kinase